MGRRKGGLIELLEVASTLPWKVSVALMPLSFVLCHWIVVGFAATPSPAELSGLSTVVIRGYINTFAIISQYILPLIFGIAALVSILRRSRSMRLVDEIGSGARAHIAGLSWQQFESFVGEGFRRRGFQVTDRGGAGPDGGVDISLSRGEERFLVQCKQWRAQKVGVAVVRELYGVMAAEHVVGGYVVTSGSFSKEASAFAAGRNIELIDGNGVAALIEGLQVSAPKPEQAEAATTKTPTSKTPTCGKCRSSMVLRTANKGSQAGDRFWGCSQFPRCRHTMAIG
jgi:restriction system protein